MNKVPKIPWWSSMGFRKPELPPDTDYADMGTAFGLDASIAPAEEAQPAGSSGDAGPAIDRLNRRSVI